MTKLKKSLLILIPLLLLFSCKPKAPVIYSIDPKIGKPGDVITLTGHNFGAAKDDSFITIAGTVPTGSSYSLWQDDMIKIRVPESGESGLVFIHVNGKKSNGVLFSNSDLVPRPIEGENFGLEPVITSVSPQTGAPGTLITITGNNFGLSREALENSLTSDGVFFSWDFDAPANPYVVREPEFIEAADLEFGYSSWGAREIQVRVPDGAVSGNLKIRTAYGESKPFIFDVSGIPGYKTFKDKRSYTINYSVDVQLLEASSPNTLYLWLPHPVTSSTQRNVSLVSRNAEPFIENHKGASLFKLDNLAAGENRTINLSYNIEVYSVETGMRPVNIMREENPIHSAYTQSSDLIPSGNSIIVSTVNSILGREQNPYIKARLLYDWLLNNIEIVEALSFPVVNTISVLEQKQADPYNAALLYTTMARAAKLPCIPAAGVLVNRNSRTLRHYWAEIWIDGFGWLPVDPVMGAAAVPSSYISKQDSANYYFGNSDNRRITFSRGEPVLSQMESRGRTVSHIQSYSLQNIWEEAAGGLESYSSLWSDIIVSGVY